MDLRKFFNDRAFAWDRQEIHDPEKIKVMLYLSGLRPGDTVLDVGCGTGVLASYFLAAGASRVWGVDFAENMIESARQKLEHPAVEFLCADILEVEGILCDQCFIYNTYPHFSQPQEVLDHLAGLIQSGGRLTISHPTGKTPHPGTPRSRFSPAQGLRGLMQNRFRPDTVVDSDVMFLVSAVRL